MDTWKWGQGKGRVGWIGRIGELTSVPWGLGFWKIKNTKETYQAATRLLDAPRRGGVSVPAGRILPDKMKEKVGWHSDHTAAASPRQHPPDLSTAHESIISSCLLHGESIISPCRRQSAHTCFHGLSCWSDDNVLLQSHYFHYIKWCSHSVCPRRLPGGCDEPQGSWWPNQVPSAPA